MPDNVNHPQHYGGDTTYEAIKVIEAWGLDFLRGNAVKYIARAGKKPGALFAQDLRKAIWYLQRAVENAEAVESARADVRESVGRQEGG